MNRFEDRAIIADRYRVYANQPAVSRREDRDEVWVFDPDLCRSVLDSEEYTAKRTGLSDRARRAGKIKLSRFFSTWLMYSDGRDHLARRAAVLAALRRVRNEVAEPVQTDLLVDIPEGLELVSDYCSPFVWSTVPCLLGLSRREAAFWRSRIRNLVALPGVSEPSTELLSAAEVALLELREYIRQSECRFFQLLKEEFAGSIPDELAADLAINIVGDGIHPTIAGLASEIWIRLDSGLGTPRTRRDCRFHEEAPFQYAARRATRECLVGHQKISPGQRVLACLGAANRTEKRLQRKSRLTFGYGRHACPGRALAESCIFEGTRTFFQRFSQGVKIVSPPQWVDSVGYRSITDLRLSRSRDQA